MQPTTDLADIEDPGYDELSVLTATLARALDQFIYAGHPCEAALTDRQIEILQYVEHHTSLEHTHG